MILLLILSARLFWMQVVEGNYYKEEADGNRIRHLPQQAARGVMYDRNGVIMAGSRPATASSCRWKGRRIPFPMRSWTVWPLF